METHILKNFIWTQMSSLQGQNRSSQVLVTEVLQRTGIFSTSFLLMLSTS